MAEPSDRAYLAGLVRDQADAEAAVVAGRIRAGEKVSANERLLERVSWLYGLADGLAGRSVRGRKAGV